MVRTPLSQRCANVVRHALSLLSFFLLVLASPIVDESSVEVHGLGLEALLVSLVSPTMVDLSFIFTVTLGAVSLMTSAVGDVADIDSPPPIPEEGDCAPFCSSWDFIAFPSPPIRSDCGYVARG